jgi:deoxyadenosine/deoxycytidine kinase
LSESALKNGSFQIVSEEIVKDGPRFFAANGTEVSMKKVVVQTYLSMINHVGETVERAIKLSALV